MTTILSTNQLVEEGLKNEREYWIERLSGELGRSGPTPDYVRSAGNSIYRGSVQLKLAGKPYQLLSDLTGNSPFLMYAAVMAALKVCLGRYSANRIIVVGSPALKEQQRTNALAIVDEIDPSATFRALLFKVRQTLLDAYARQRYPFQRLIGDPRLSKYEGQWPLFNVAMSLAELHGTMPELQFDMMILLERDASALTGRIEFNRQIFKRESIASFKDCLVNVLTNALESKDEPIATLSPTSDLERRQILLEWNDTATFTSQDITLPKLFAQQAHRTPETLALICEDQFLTYQELDRRTTSWSVLLRSMSVSQESVVGVLMDRSVEMVLALLGVLKAGAAYLPLDPAYPSERLQFMSADSGAQLLLTEGDRRDRAKLDAQLVVRMDETEAGMSADLERCSEVHIFPDNLAYVIYTSGSTGRPKGVMNTHAGLCNRLVWMQNEFDLRPEDRVLQKTPFSFDVSVWEFFWPLIAGATLVMARPRGHQDGDYLADVITREQITSLHFVPSMLKAFLKEERSQHRYKCLRQVMCSGEVLSTELQDQFYERVQPARLYNLYGPTEAAIDVSLWACEPNDRRSSVPIGRAISNTRLYILDEKGALLPVGVGGELHIGGIGLARGYRGRAELTAEAFVPDGISLKNGERLYRTGDDARWRAGGEIEFIGRRDDQVKLRGCRIELGEIETVARQQENVSEAVVVSRNGRAEGQRLMCYVVWQQKQSREGRPAEEAPVAAERIRQLREQMRRQLPEYMVPGMFVELAEMPLQPNGKVDRKRLHEHDDTSPTVRDDYDKPRTPIEQMLVTTWRQVLGVEQVGIHEDFFELGGHSLTSMQIVSRIRRELDLELPMGTLFERPTIAKLAERISSVLSSGDYSAPKLQPIPRTGELPLSYSQQRLWLIDLVESPTIGYNVTGGVRLCGSLNIAALQQGLEALVERHEVLRTVFATLEGRPSQIIVPHFSIASDLVDLGHFPEHEKERVVESLASEDARQKFDLSSGPLIRVTLFRVGREDHVFLIVIHHIVCDGWSMRVLIRELATLYEALSQGNSSPLPDLTIQYADFSYWQRQWLQSGALDRQLAYWRKQLEPTLPLLNIPTDKPRHSIPTFRGATRDRLLSKTLSEALRRLGRNEGATLFMVLLSAFKVLLSYCTKQQDIVVGTNISGRTWSETEGLIGFFVNELVIRTDLTGDPTFRALLRRVKEVTLGAYSHQDVPFDRLVHALAPERNLTRAPLFQVLVDFQDEPAAPRQLPGLLIAPAAIDFAVAYFDLTLQVVDTGGPLSIALHFKADLFESATITRMLENLEWILGRITKHPNVHLEHLIAQVAWFERQSRLRRQTKNRAANLRDLKESKRRSVHARPD